MQIKTDEDLAEYIKATSEVLTGLVKALESINSRITTLEDEMKKLDRILGNMVL